MKPIEIIVIIVSAVIVVSVILANVIKRKQGKTCCCDCGKCSLCGKNTEKKDGKEKEE